MNQSFALGSVRSSISWRWAKKNLDRQEQARNRSEAFMLDASVSSSEYIPPALQDSPVFLAFTETNYIRGCGEMRTRDVLDNLFGYMQEFLFTLWGSAAK